MTTTLEQIAALAAQLNEADLAAIIRAKVPAKVAGHEIKNVWFYSDIYGGRVEHSVTLFACGKNVSACTFDGAVLALSAAIGDPMKLAADKREQAERLLAEAAKLEGGQ